MKTIHDKKLGWITPEKLEKLQNTQLSAYDLEVILKNQLEEFIKQTDCMPPEHEKYVIECLQRINYEIMKKYY